jgi:hypothetical protein
MPANFDHIPTNAYKATPKNDPRDRIEVEVGDSKQADFFPQLKMMRWDNEVNLSVRLINHGEMNPQIVQTADRIRWRGSKIEADFYDLPVSDALPEGASEFEITLKQKPNKNTIEFSINTKGLKFFYQPALTAAEIAAGHVRPDHVVGSYAVYTDEDKVNIAGGKLYRSGKVGHIYRPRIEDANGAWTWGDLSIDEQAGTLTVTIPQTFLDTAAYPVKHAAGLTIGHTTVGASENNGLSDFMVFGARATPSAGTTSKTSAYVAATSGNTTTVKAGLWKDSDGTLIGATPSGQSVSSTTRAWVDNTLVQTIAAESTQVAFFFSNGAGCGNYDDVGNSSGIVASRGGTFNSPGSTTVSTRDYKYSVYATYEPSSQNYTLSLAGAINADRLVGTVQKAGQARKTGSATSSGVARKAPQTRKTGATTSAGVLQKAAQVRKTGTAASSATILKARLMGLAASIASGATLIRDSFLTHSGTAATAGVVGKMPMLTVSGSIASTGSSARASAAQLAGSVASAGATIASTARSLVGAIASSATATTAIAYVYAVAGAIAAAATVTRGAFKSTAGAIAPASAIDALRTLYRIFTGDVMPTGAFAKHLEQSTGGTVTTSGGVVEAIKVFTETMVGSMSLSGDIRRDSHKRLAGGIASAARTIADLARSFAGAIMPTGSILPNKHWVATATGAIASAGTQTRQTARALIASIGSAAIIRRTSSIFRGSDLAPSGDISIYRQLYRTMTGLISSTGIQTRAALRAVAGAISSVNTLLRRDGSKALTADLTPTGEAPTLRTLGRFFSGDLTPNGVVVTAKTLFRYFVGLISPKGQSSLPNLPRVDVKASESSVIKATAYEETI